MITITYKYMDMHEFSQSQVKNNKTQIKRRQI